jgi:hypothetical protein
MCRDSWLGRPRVDDLKADLHPSKNVKFGIRRTLQFPVTAFHDRNELLRDQDLSPAFSFRTGALTFRGLHLAVHGQPMPYPHEFSECCSCVQTGDQIISFYKLR